MNDSTHVSLHAGNQSRGYFQSRWLITALVFFGLGTLLWFAFSIFNPDWLSYQLLYETGGAWLSDQGRDPLFLLLLALANSLFGPSGYETFRLVLSFYFLFFSTAAAWGRIIPIARSRWIALQFPLAIISFCFTRFTVQIREGLAATLILIGFACVIRADATSNFMRRTILVWLGLVFVGCSALVHVGTIPILASLLSVLVLFNNYSGEIKARRMKFLWAAVLITGFMFLGWIASGGVLEQADSLELGISEHIRYEEQTDMTPLRVMLWVGYGFVSFVIAKALRELVSVGQIRGRLAATLLVTSGPITFVVITSIYTLMIIGAPNFFTGQYVRLLNILLGINLLFVASSSKRWALITLCSIFLIAYQVWSILDSISRYFGVGLLM